MIFCMQRILKSIVEVLGIPKSGTLLLSKDEDFTDASYFTVADGRLRFKTGWSSFCTDNGLVKDKLVLIMFSIIDDVVMMSIDVVN